MSSSEWREVKLGDICEISSSKRIYAKEYISSGTPFYRGKEIIEKFKGNDISNELFISNERFNELKDKFGAPAKDDILLTSVGTLGVPYLVQNEKFYFKDGNLTWFKNFKESHSKFIYLWLQSSYAKNQIDSKAIGSTQKALTIDVLKKFEIKLPPIKQQEVIASTLSCLDDKIGINNRINKNLEEMAQAIFKSWFVDFEPFQDGEFDDSEFGRIPKGWKVVELGEICNCILGGTPNRREEKYWNGNIPWINSGKVNEYRIIEAVEYITELGLKKSATTLLPAKTTVLAITGATLGQVSLLEISSCSNQSVVGVLENDDVPYEFIYPMINNRIEGIISHQTGGAQQHINKSNIEKEKLVLPSKEVILAYRQTVTGLYQYIANTCFEIKKLQEIRDLLLPKLMSGEIRLTKDGGVEK